MFILLRFDTQAKQKWAHSAKAFKFRFNILFLAQLFIIVNGNCDNSNKVITFNSCTSIATQNYTLGSPLSSATNTFSIIDGGNSCRNDDIKLDYIKITSYTNDVFESDW